MKILIVEDEAMARNRLARMINDNFSGLEIVGMTGSIAETVKWLETPSNRADVIFLDIELSDGVCFEIFRKTAVTAKVIMTTAYDNYAIKAFEAGSVDYLLKPVELSSLQRALSRCHSDSILPADLTEVISHLSFPAKSYKERFIVRFNDYIIPILTSDIAYIYSEDKYNYIITKSNNKYIVDSSLDIIMGEISPEQFFRISRSCIISLSAIKSVVKHIGGRLRIMASPPPSFDMLTSRSRTDDFIKWLEK